MRRMTFLDKVRRVGEVNFVFMIVVSWPVLSLRLSSRLLFY